METFNLSRSVDPFAPEVCEAGFRVGVGGFGPQKQTWLPLRFGLVLLLQEAYQRQAQDLVGRGVIEVVRV